MTRRCAVLLVGSPAPAAPPGIGPAALAQAMIEDVAELLHGLSQVDSLVVCQPGHAEELSQLVWPEVPVVEREGADLAVALDEATGRGYDEAVVVTPDAPDLPQMLLGKLFQALGRSLVAVLPAQDGTAVGLACRLPAPAWLVAGGLDDPTAVARLRAAAGAPRQVAVIPAWHRIRTAPDVRRLDPGLEGWERTRALLGGLTTRREV